MNDPNLRDLRAAVDRNLPAALDALRGLVSLNSFTRNREGVLENARVIEALFQPLGLEPERVRAREPDQGDHVFLERRGSGPRRIVLVSHLDTVYRPEEEARHDFAWCEEEDRIRGPGVADIKGGTVMIWLVLSAIHDAHLPLFRETTWSVFLNAAEEEGSPDFPSLARERLEAGAEACLVFECSNELPSGANTLAHARRGAARVLVETRGRAAHSGSGHHLGANAVRELARVIETVEALSRPDEGLTFNVGRVEGGEVINSVPDRARAWIDMRAATTQQYEDGIARLEGLAGPGTVEARSDGFRCSVHVSRLAGYPPWPRNEGSDGLAELFLEVAAELGLPHELEFRQGASDGNHLWDLCPTIDGLGPAGSHIHCAELDPKAGKEQESVRRSSFAERALLSARVIERLIGTHGRA